MFVTILTIIYLALALFILVRFLKEKSIKVGNVTNNFKHKLNKIFIRKSEINKHEITYTSEISNEGDERKLQPEYKRS